VTRKSPNFIAQLDELQPASRARVQIFECPECDGSGEDEAGKECPGCCGSGVLVAMVPEDSAPPIRR
jgi:hypothetical protein